MDDAGVLDVSHQLLVEEEVVQGRQVCVALPLVGVGEIHTKPLPGDLQVRLDDSIVDRTAVPAITTQATASCSVFLIRFWMTAKVSSSSGFA